MNARSKLIRAQDLLLHLLKDDIQSINLDAEHPTLKVTFSKGVLLYIRYNDYGHYSYQVIFSTDNDDWIRFDDYDAIWPVKSKPHHFHDHGQKNVNESKMTSDPDVDIPILVKYLK
jgi:hypothetical protein